MRVDKTQAYADWIDSLEDRAGRARILVRVERLIGGNPGQHRNLAGGISELKIDVGPGYRVYFGKEGDKMILLLAGGTKRRQQADIDKAREHWRIHRTRKH